MSVNLGAPITDRDYHRASNILASEVGLMECASNMPQSNEYISRFVAYPIEIESTNGHRVGLAPTNDYF
jgi:hypothetical protein